MHIALYVISQIWLFIILVIIQHEYEITFRESFLLTMFIIIYSGLILMSEKVREKRKIHDQGRNQENNNNGLRHIT